MAPERLEKFDAWVAQRGVGALLLGRLIPSVPFTLMNYAAGLAHVSWLNFTWTTAVGILPIIILEVMATTGSRQSAGLWFLAALLVVGAGVRLGIKRPLLRIFPHFAPTEWPGSPDGDG